MKKRPHSFDIVLGLTLVLVFSSFLLLTLLSGARLYKDIAKVMEEQYGTSTVLAYISAKVRANDSLDAVTVGELEGLEALILSEEIDGTIYNTYIYCRNGKLNELMCEADAGLGPDSGLEIMSVDSLSFETAAGGAILRFSCSCGEEKGSQSVCLLSGKTGAA